MSDLLFYFLIVTAEAPGTFEEREYTTLEACQRLQRAYDLAPFFGRSWIAQEKGVSSCYAKSLGPAVMVLLSFYFILSASEERWMLRGPFATGEECRRVQAETILVTGYGFHRPRALSKSECFFKEESS